jgi:hypothetical protein
VDVQEFDFTLILSGISELTDEVENAVYEAGCDDATLSICDGVVYLDFTRESSSLKEAITTAISDVHKTKYRVVRVDSEAYQTVTQINADLLAAVATITK